MYEVIKVGGAAYAVVEDGREITRFAFREDAARWAREAQALKDQIEIARAEKAWDEQ